MCGIVGYAGRRNALPILEDATRKALHEARGSYAILAIHADEPGKVVGARNESPLVVGVGPDENFLASDVPALLRYTDRVLYVMDKEMVVITPKGVSLTDLEGKAVARHPGGGPRGPPSRIEDPRDLERGRLQPHARGRQDDLHARRDRDRRRGDEDVHRAARGPLPDRPEARPRPGRPRLRRTGSPEGPVALAPAGRPVRPEQGGRDTRAREEVRQRQGHVLHRAPRELPRGLGGRPEAEGDLLHPCGGLCGGRVEARTSRPRDPVDPGGRRRGPRPDVPEDAIEHRGGVRARVARPRDRNGGGQGTPQVRGRRVRGPRHPVDLLAGAGERRAPTLRLRSRAHPRLPDRQAAEPREERHRRMNFRRSLHVENRYRGRPSVGFMPTIEVVRKDHLTPGAVSQGSVETERSRTWSWCGRRLRSGRSRRGI